MHDLRGSIIRTVDESYDNKMCFSVNDSSQINTLISFSFINITCTGDENYFTIYAAPLYNCRQAMLQAFCTEKHDLNLYTDTFHFLGLRT